MSVRRGVLAALGLALAAGQAAAQGTQAFDHAKHARLFPSCVVCHAGAAHSGAPMWPDSAECATCHDGTVEKRLSWRTPTEPPPTNLRFDHAGHARAVAERPAARGGPYQPVACTACHQPQGAAWMTVRLAVVERCLDCHDVRAAHLATPDTACSTCHVSLAHARRLTTNDIAAFPAPPSHEEPGYAGAEGHGASAQIAGANCATCHGRDFCLQCHVDAPERPAIAELPADPRSTAIHATLRAPASHADAGFLTGHGATARRAPETCATCHTRESCVGCHVGTPRVAAKLASAGPGRAAGAAVGRRRPPSHGQNYTERHATAAVAGAAVCAGCHIRSDCLACHRPDAARAAAYHARGFLARHPAAAYARETTCSDCHNTAGFCTRCHATAGLVAHGGPLRPGYHDFTMFFIAGHGQAARQNLETCVGCHVEKDCLTCHSALGGRRFNPHGPGFDANRLIKKNPQMCTACHGTAIPTP